MLKSMPKKQNNLTLWIIVAVLVIAGIVTLIASFSSSDGGLDDVSLAYTSAAETLLAQQLTNLASASSTPTVFLFTSTATLTPTLLSTPTVFLQTTLASPTTSVTSSYTTVGCDDSVYLADVTIPDGTEMIAGEVFKKIWKLQNTGTCTWTTAYKVTFLSGNQMKGVADPITVEVAPGKSIDVSVSMTASANNNGTGLWILTNANGQQFGTSFSVIIKVNDPADPPSIPLPPSYP